MCILDLKYNTVHTKVAQSPAPAEKPGLDRFGLRLTRLEYRAQRQRRMETLL